MKPDVFTQLQARKIILHAAGLARKAQFGTGIEAAYRVIDHLGFLQLDTNYVVERAHHHALAARIHDYQTEWLATLCEEGLIFECFASESGYFPMHEFRYSLPVKESFATHRKPLTPAETVLMKEVLDRVEREGPLQVGDFEYDRVEASSGWWDWRPAKIALERLYMDGKLMITRGKTFQKLYDLPMNLIPAGTDITTPAPEEFARYIIRRTLGALGIAHIKEVAWRARRVKGHLIKKELEKMVAEGEVKTLLVEGIKNAPLYMLSTQPVKVKLSGEAFILSPFDVLNVFRHRLKDFFNFDYQVECFVPAPKRKYGYFSLPVLIGDTFVARMDAKADRKQKVLIIHNLHFEEVKLNETMLDNLIETLQAFVQFNQCKSIVISKCNKATYRKAIEKAFQNAQ